MIDTKGVVAWIGHPMQLQDQMIEQVLAGTFDIQKAAADYQKEVKEQAAREKEMAPVRAKLTAMRGDMGKKNWDEALNDLAAAEKLMPEAQGPAYKVFFARNRFRILLSKKDYPSAYKLAAQLSDENKGNAGLQNDLAWQIISDKTIEKPDLDLAELLSNRANEAAHGKDPDVLDTQARVLFLKGQKQEAVKAQAEAVALAEPDRKPALQSRLDSYKKGELPAAN